jgi:hypothetical protein
VIDALRPHVPSLWQRMPTRDKRLTIFTLGPPLRGLWYETTAIPEIRDQAASARARRPPYR